VETARAQVASLIGAEPSEICFTSGGTEANNIAILGLAEHLGKGHIITSVVEHPAVLFPLHHLKKKGFRITRLPVDSEGVVKLEELERAIEPDTVLITIMHANNETGTMEPVAEISKIAREKGILFHSDAAQSVGKAPVNVRELGVDMLSMAGHKLYGPKGVGALFIKDGLDLLKPIMFGAAHERGLKPGTENVPGIVGLGVACSVAGREMAAEIPRIMAFRDRLLEELRKGLSGIRVNGEGAERLANTLNIHIPRVDANALVMALKDEVAISAGAACHEGAKTPSHVLKAMGLTDEEAFSSIRISLGRYNTEAEVREAAGILLKAVHRLARAR
jgi:cysteine desulfurase